MDPKGVIAIVFCVAGLGALFVASSSEWYHIEERALGGALSARATHELYQDKVIVTSTLGQATNTNTGDYTHEYPGLGAAPETGNVQNNVKTMTMISMILIVVSIILIIPVSLYKMKNIFAFVLIFVVAILIFLIPIYSYYTLSEALIKDYTSHNKESPCPGFISTKTGSFNYTSTCGPGNGWSMTFVSGIMIVIAGALVGRIVPSSPVIVSAPQYASQPVQYRP